MQVPVNELNSTLIAIWSVVAVVAVVGLVLLGWGLRLERRKFAALGKSGQWLWVRIATLLPCAPMRTASAGTPRCAVARTSARSSNACAATSRAPRSMTTRPLNRAASARSDAL